MKRHIEIKDTKALVAEAFCNFLRAELKDRASYHIALSGGSTPKDVFDLLSTARYGDIDWSKVYLYWGDERCVPPTDNQSNYKMTNDHLISRVDIPATNVHRIHGEEIPAQEAERYGKIISESVTEVDGLPQFDLVMLGLGEDGHTASIFPNQIALWDSPKNCEIATHPDSGQKRITITGKLINHAKKVAFLVTGASKADKVREIIQEDGDYQVYPASKVQPSDGEVYWFLDTDAATGMK